MMTSLKISDSYKVNYSIMAKWGQAIPLLLLPLLANSYIYLNAQNDWYADVFLLILLLVSLPRLVNRSVIEIEITKKIIFFLIGYLGISLLSLLFPPSVHIHQEWLVKSFFRILIACLIVQATIPKSLFEQNILRRYLPILCFVISTIILLSAAKILDKTSLTVLTPWPVISHDWNNKVFGFALVFLMWSAVGALWRQSKIESFLAVLLIIIVFAALLEFNSESAQFAGFCGVIVFCLTHISFKTGRYWIYLCIFMAFLIIPLVLVLFGPFIQRDPMVVFNDATSFFKQHWSIGERVYIYEFSASLVREKLFFGYGFGSMLSLPLPEGVIPGWWSIPGNHPHNIVFLIFVDHGLIGFLGFVCLAYMFFNYIYKNTLDHKEAPAIWALIMSGQVIFSLSFSIWHPDVVLTYVLFFSSIFMVIRYSKDSKCEELNK